MIFPLVTFETATHRYGHFKKHVLQRKEFACADEYAYEALASAFLDSPLGDTTLQCRRPQGDIIRYDFVTLEFGIFGRNGFILSYFRPSTLNHFYPSNYCYFYYECWRVF
jgi:pyocin large subunit-like protein